MEQERLILEQKTIFLLDKSKKMQSKYSNERHILFEYFNNPNANLDDWENYINEFENLLTENSTN